MKKLILLAAVMLLLAACGGKAATKEKQTGEENHQANENNSAPQNEPEKEEPADEPEEEEKAEAPAYRMNEHSYALEPIENANPKVALLTIDDAPDKYALEMAKTLKSLDAPAIFFVNGHFINSPEKEQIVKEIHQLGFPIGNHTFSHDDLTTLPPEKQREEMLSVNEKVEEIIGEKPKFFRAPFGKNTDLTRQIAADEGMLVMNWTYGYDWEEQYMDAGALADIMVNTEYLGDGANLLMHDREWTNGALKNIVEGLRAKGYELLDPNVIETPEAAQE